MRSNKQFYTPKGSYQAGLYSFVFTRRISTFAIVFLFVSFLVQPFHQALANEAVLEDLPETVLPDEVAEQLPDQVDSESETVEEPEDEEQVETGASPDEPTEETTDDTGVEEDAAEEETASTTPDTTEDEEISDEDDTASSTDETSGGESTATTTDETGGDSGADDNDTASSTDETGDTASSTPPGDTGTSTSTTTDDGSGSGNGGGDSGDGNNYDTGDSDNNGNGGNDSGSNNESGTTTDDLIDGQAVQDGVDELVDEVVNEVVAITRQLVTEENYYQFSRQSCVSVGDGTYHCTTNEPLAVDPDSAVFAEQDSEGDMEIFMRTSKGDIKQLTDNSYDDTSPDVDLASMRVVWQRLVEGRYQVISYDLEEREETQLTFSKNNSMEPKVAREGIVWQAWDGTDWEIMFFDGQFTDQITDNDGIQDVTPVVEDGYILWSVLGGEESEARVYSLESGERMTISGHEGGTVANPRFVLVYDTKFENGDVVTVGFDPVTGLAQPVSSRPSELPFNIPEPDPIGEIRALIQNKSTSDENEVVAEPTTDDGDDLNLATTTATSSDTLSLDNIELEEEGTVELPPSEDDLELDDNDLVITDNASSTESEINNDIETPNLPETATGTVATSTQP